MNYDAILAIFNCFKDKINYIAPTTNIKKEIPDDIKEWYKEWKNNPKENNNQDKFIKNNISSIKETNYGETCIYYISPREVDQRIITDTPPTDKLFNIKLEQHRDKMIKETIYKYLSTILNGIEILPFDVKKLEDKSVYECRIKGNNNEQIKIDYDETKYSTSLKIRNETKYLKVSLIPNLKSTRYDGMITIQKPKLKSNWFIKNLFQKKSKFELNNAEKADFISITKDEVQSNLEATGTTYEAEGLYIYEIKDNKFTINYYDQETINTILTTNFNKRPELNSIVKILKDKKELTNRDFITKLEQYGLLTNATFTLTGVPKELQSLVNKAYTNPKALLQDLYKTK